MISLIFAPEDAESYASVYLAWRTGEPRLVSGAKSLRTALEVYDQLDTLGEQVEDHDGRQVGTRLKPGGGSTTISREAWLLFRSVVRQTLEDGVQPYGRVLDARRSLAALAWLERHADAR
jgi:hypothetical protein